MASAYSPAQLDRYLEYVEVPEKYRRQADAPPSLEYLKVLHMHQISRIPYENLQLHYATNNTVSLDPHVIFDKVTNNGRGGFCLELAILFNNVLKALGFSVYIGGAKGRLRADGVPYGDFLGWVHAVNIVTLPDGQRYMTDVGYGGDGPLQPFPLEHGVVLPNIGTQELRLIHDNLPNQIHSDSKYWIVQYRNSPEKPWTPMYGFVEFEFVTQDLAVINYYVSNCPISTQTYQVLAVKFLRRPGEPSAYGKAMLVGPVVKLNEGGKTRVVKTCASEQERVEALKEYFDISLTLDECSSITKLRIGDALV